MEIEEFVRESLLQIMRGVRGAIDAWDGKGSVNPTVGSHPGGAKIVRHADGLVSIRPVDFDLSVLVSERAGKEGKAKLAVFGQGFGGGASKGTERAETSRIKFSVDIALPHSKVKQE